MVLKVTGSLAPASSQITSRKEVIRLVDYLIVLIFGIGLFVMVILDLIDELKK